MLSASTMWTTFKLPGDNKSVLFHGLVLLGGGLEQPPVLGMSLDRRFNQLIEFGNTAELVEALDRVIQILRHFASVGFWFQDEWPVQVIRLFPVAVSEQFFRPPTIWRP